jgi:hypothetical protein
MATDMVNGYIYFLESEAATNINWVPTVDNIILAALYTEGTEYVKLQIPESLKVAFKTGIIVIDSGGGSSFDYRPNRRAYNVLARGIETSRTNAATVRNFFMLDSHTSGAAATFKRYYMVIKYGTTTYEKFINAAGTAVDYCKGVVLDGYTTWRDDEPLVATVHLNWRSVW